MNTERTTTARKSAWPSGQCLQSLAALLALLAALATAQGAAAQQNRTDTIIEQMVFQQDRTAAAARARLNSELSSHVNDIDRVCRLTEAQKTKLHLADVVHM